jgi:hypothetical protein
MRIRIKEEEVDKQEADIVSQLKTQMGSLVNTINTTLDDKTKEQNEGLLTVAGLAVAMPAILGLVAKFGKGAGTIINKVIGKKPTMVDLIKVSTMMEKFINEGYSKSMVELMEKVDEHISTIGNG